MMKKTPIIPFLFALAALLLLAASCRALPDGTADDLPGAAQTAEPIVPQSPIEGNSLLPSPQTLTPAATESTAEPSTQPPTQPPTQTPTEPATQTPTETPIQTDDPTASQTPADEPIVRCDEHTVAFRIGTMLAAVFHDGENVTGYATYTDMGSNDAARRMAAQYEGNYPSGVEEFTVVESYLVAHYAREYFPYATYEELMETAEYLDLVL